MDRKRVLRNPVFIVSSLFLSVLVILGAIMPEAFGEVAGMLFDFTTNNFGWFYLLAVFVIILFLIGLAFSRYGSIRLGKDNQEPEFPFFTWIGMLFSAGFGAGLVFWGVAEPMSHFFLIHLFFRNRSGNRGSSTCCHGIFFLSLGN